MTIRPVKYSAPATLKDFLYTSSFEEFCLRHGEQEKWASKKTDKYVHTLVIINTAKRCPKTDLCRESTEKCEPEVAQCKRKVLVEEILEKFAHANVRPSAMDKQQPLKEAELSECVVTGHHGLHAFLTTDANSDVRHYTNTQHS